MVLKESRAAERDILKVTKGDTQSLFIGIFGGGQSSFSSKPTIRKEGVMKKILGITLFVFLFLASNCFAVTFTYLEVLSDNRASEWRFSADLTLAPSYSPSYVASFAVVGGSEYTLNHIFYGVDVYDSGSIGAPLDFANKTCSWNVTDGTDEIYATGSIPPLVRQVALSMDVTISAKPTPNHPTVSWKNLDPSLTVYRLRVTEASNPMNLLWQTNIAPSGQNMTYTFCGFSFKPEIDYAIRIEARQYIPFTVTGMGLGTLTQAILQNRSTVFVNYAYDTPAPSPTGDVYTDPQTGLDWLVMSKTVCKSPDSIKNGTDGDNLASLGWEHATNQQITELLINADMQEPFDGTSSPWNYEAAKLVLDVLGYTYEHIDSNGQSLSIQAFSKEGPSSPSGYLYTPVVIVGHMVTGDVGGALVPGPAVPSFVSSGTIGNWLVRPHPDDIPPTLAPLPDKTILWPPNHKMVTVSILANASDDSGGPVTLAATVSSNEPENGLGDGDTAPDWTTPLIDQTDGIITLQLRAERSGRGNGRVYTVTITATDGSGNRSQANVDIIVPRDQRKK